MSEIQFREGALSPDEQSIVSKGFFNHSADANAPEYRHQAMNWTIQKNEKLVGVLTAKSLWDWLYIDELWVDSELRGTGIGRDLVEAAERFAKENSITGLWLWTQSWQAEDFYRKMGFQEFTRFPDFPKGHQRIGFRKTVD